MAKNIEVTLTLNSKDFDRKLRTAKGSLKDFSQGGNVARGTVIGLAARLAPLAAGFVAVKGSIDGLSRSLGVASRFEDVQIVLENIVGSAEGGAAALAKIRDVAKDLPVSFEELATAAPGLATVSKSIGELEDNIRLTADIAANFGIPFDVAAGQIQRSFSAGAGAADVFRERGVLAAAGFEAGVKVSIDETIAKFREFGLEVEGSANKLATTLSGAVNQAGDALTDFQAAIGEAFKEEVTVAVTELTKRFRENEEEILKIATAIGTNAFNGFVKFGRAVAITIDTVRKLLNPVIQFNEGLKALGTNLPIVATAIFVVVKAQKAFKTATLAAANAFIFLQGITGVGLLKVGAGIVAATATTAALTVAVNEAAEAFEDSEESTDGALGAFNEFVDIVNVGASEIRQDAGEIGDAFTKVGDDTEIAMNKAGNSVKDLTDKLFTQTGLSDFGNKLASLLGVDTISVILRKFKDDGRIFNSVIANSEQAFKSFIQFADAVDVIDTAFEENLITQEQYNRAVKLIEEQFEALGIGIEEIRPLIDQIDEAFAEQEGLRSFITTFGQAQKALSEDLATSLVEGKSAAEAFQSFFKKLVVQLIADALRLAIIQPILGSLFGVSFGAGGAISGLTGGGLFGFIGGKANGGPVMKNKPYIVGERGPELFVPGQSGGIVPNEALGMGGGTTVNYNIQAVDAQSFQALVARDPEFIFAVTEAGRRRLPQ